jgi:hypothetical protein
MDGPGGEINPSTNLNIQEDYSKEFDIDKEMVDKKELHSLTL